jgi:hypothetical protein
MQEHSSHTAPKARDQMNIKIADNETGVKGVSLAVSRVYHFESTSKRSTWRFSLESTLSSAGTPSPRAIDECTTTTHIHHPLPPQSSHFSAQYRLLRPRINSSRSVRAPTPIISHPPTTTTMAPSTFASAAAGSNSNAQPRDAGSEW